MADEDGGEDGTHRFPDLEDMMVVDGCGGDQGFQIFLLSFFLLSSLSSLSAGEVSRRTTDQTPLRIDDDFEAETCVEIDDEPLYTEAKVSMVVMAGALDSALLRYLMLTDLRRKADPDKICNDETKVQPLVYEFYRGYIAKGCEYLCYGFDRGYETKLKLHGIENSVVCRITDSVMRIPLGSKIDWGYEVIKAYADHWGTMDMDMRTKLSLESLKDPLRLLRDIGHLFPETKVGLLQDLLRLMFKAIQPDIVPASYDDGTGDLYIPMVHPDIVPVSGSHVIGVRCTSEGEIVSVINKSAAGEYSVSKAKSRLQREFKLSPPKRGENVCSMDLTVMYLLPQSNGPASCPQGSPPKPRENGCHQRNGPVSSPPGSPPEPHENGRHQSNGPASSAGSPPEPRENGRHQRNGPVSSPPGSPPDPRENGRHQSNGRVSSHPGYPAQPPVMGHPESSMGQPSNEPVHVYGSEYTSRDPVNLIFEKSKAGGYSVSAAEGNSVRWKFETSPCDTPLHRKIELVELLAENRPRIAMLEAKNTTTCGRWVVLSCDGERKRTVCSIRRGRDGTDVLAALKNSSRYACDFKFTGDLLRRNCTIFKGDSLRRIAEMHPMKNTDSFMVEVYPNVDSAFVVSFIAIAAVINDPGKVKEITGKAIDIAGASLSLSGGLVATGTGAAIGQIVIG